MSALPPDDDATLVSRILRGEPTLFERLVRRYNQRLYRAARAHLGDDASAEDVTQQAWMSIYKALGQWTGKGSFSGWALTIVTNACLKLRGRMSDSLNDDDAELEGMSTANPGPDEETHRQHVRVRLHRARRSLKTALEAQLAGEEKELFSFMGARCDRLTAAVLKALQIPRPV